MPQPFQQPPQFKTRTAVVIFTKSSAAPIILYFENPMAVYEELAQIVKTSSAAGKFIEKDTIGPIKKFCIHSNQIAGIAIQEEQYV